MVKFVRKASEPYTLITPGTALEVLENFLNSSIFALGMSSIVVTTTDF